MAFVNIKEDKFITIDEDRNACLKCTATPSHPQGFHSFELTWNGEVISLRLEKDRTSSEKEGINVWWTVRNMVIPPALKNKENEVRYFLIEALNELRDEFWPCDHVHIMFVDHPKTQKLNSPCFEIIWHEHFISFSTIQTSTKGTAGYIEEWNIVSIELPTDLQSQVEEVQCYISQFLKAKVNTLKNVEKVNVSFKH